MGLSPVRGQISTVVSSPSTFGTVICPIWGLHSGWSFLTGVRLELTLAGYSVNHVRVRDRFPIWVLVIEPFPFH